MDKPLNLKTSPSESHDNGLSISYSVYLFNSPKVLVLKTLTGVKFIGGSKSLVSSDMLGETSGRTWTIPFSICGLAVMREQTECPGSSAPGRLSAESHEGSQFFQGKQRNGAIVITSQKWIWERWEEASAFSGNLLLVSRLGRTETIWSSPGK